MIFRFRVGLIWPSIIQILISEITEDILKCMFHKCSLPHEAGIFSSLSANIGRETPALYLGLWCDFNLSFYCSHYASCLEYLGNLKANLLLDIHLHGHVETLYDQIRKKALIQYTHPFVSVDMRMMANAFKTTISGLEKELEGLITDNQIQVGLLFHDMISIQPFCCCCMTGISVEDQGLF